MTQVVVRVIDLHIVRWVGGEPLFLVLKRSPGQQYEGIWQGVTGKIEDGEQAWEAAVRELREETALSPLKLWTVDRVNFFYEAHTDQMNSIPVFGAEVAGEAPTLSGENESYRWATVEEAAGLILWEQQRQGLLAFHDMLTNSRAKLRWMAIDLAGGE